MIQLFWLHRLTQRELLPTMLGYPNTKQSHMDAATRYMKKKMKKLIKALENIWHKKRKKNEIVEKVLEQGANRLALSLLMMSGYEQSEVANNGASASGVPNPTAEDDISEIAPLLRRRRRELILL